VDYTYTLDLEEILNDMEDGRKVAFTVINLLARMDDAVPIQSHRGGHALRHINLEDFWKQLESYTGGTGIAKFDLEVE